MATLRLFSNPSVQDRNLSQPGPAIQHRRLALLALLAAHRKSGLRRDKLLGLLWPDADAERGRHQLSNAVYALRQALGREVILSDGGDTLRLNPTCTRVDLWDFLDALEQKEPERAAGLYAGPFLDSLFVSDAPEFERWTQGERDRLSQLYAEALETLAQDRELGGDLRGAVVWWRKLAAHDPFSSRVALRLMQALAAAGDRAAAIRQARVYEALMREELGLEPDTEVKALAEQLRTEAAPGRGDAATSAAGPPPLDGGGGGRTASTSVLLDGDAGSAALAESGPAGSRPQALAAAVNAAPARPWAAWRRRRIWAGGISLILVIVAGALVWTRSGQAGAAGAREPPIRALAVLPLENLSGDPAQEYFADGMTDELITELARVGQMRVISRTSVMPYKETRKPLPQIARELGVDAVVEGTVRRAGDRVRITAQLIRAQDDAHLWTQSYERELKDILALQQEVAWAIAGGVRGALALKDRTRMAPVRSLVPEAYDYYLRGKLYRRQVSEPDGEKAVVMLERAVAIDPAFAAAYGELALAYAYLYSIFRSGEAELAEKALLAAEKALSIEPGQPEAHLARGRILWTPAYGFPHEGAIREFQRALAQNPNSEEAHFQLGQVYFHVGLLDEAIAAFREALAINPVDPRPRVGMGQALLYQMQPREALSVFRQTPEDYNPPTRGPHAAWSLLLLGRHAEAATVLEGALARDPEDRNGTLSAMQAVLAAAGGDHAQAEEKIRLAATKQRGSIHFHHAEYSIGTAYSLMNQPDSAMKWLRAAVEEGFPSYPLFARDPSLQRLRDDPRFTALLNELQAQWKGYRALFGADAGITSSRP